MSLIFTLWSFLGLLVLPTPSRRGVADVDRNLLETGCDRDDLERTIRLLDDLQDRERQRPPVIETIFLSVLWRKVVEPLGVTSFYVYWLMPAAVVIVASILSERHFERPVGRILVERFARGGARRPAMLAPAE